MNLVVRTSAKNGHYKNIETSLPLNTDRKEEILAIQGRHGNLKLEQKDFLCPEVKMMLVIPSFAWRG
jgi:hypothetical protein